MNIQYDAIKSDEQLVQVINYELKKFMDHEIIRHQGRVRRGNTTFVSDIDKTPFLDFRSRYCLDTFLADNLEDAVNELVNHIKTQLHDILFKTLLDGYSTSKKHEFVLRKYPELTIPGLLHNGRLLLDMHLRIAVTHPQEFIPTRELNNKSVKGTELVLVPKGEDSPKLNLI